MMIRALTVPLLVSISVLVPTSGLLHSRSIPLRLDVTQSFARYRWELFSSHLGTDNRDDNSFKQAASNLLMWETLEQSARRPILNLSQREDSPETSNPVDDTYDTSKWDQGQRWKITKLGILNRGVVDPEAFLEACPQLFRLESNMVLETADLVLEEYGMPFLELEPQLLSFRAPHITYGLEFISTMMMMTDNAKLKAVCRASPALLIGGIEGGIQEQAVQAALGAAGAATIQANQQIAGDAMSALQSLKRQQKGL